MSLNGVAFYGRKGGDEAEIIVFPSPIPAWSAYFEVPLDGNPLYIPVARGDTSIAASSLITLYRWARDAAFETSVRWFMPRGEGDGTDRSLELRFVSLDSRQGIEAVRAEVFFGEGDFGRVPIDDHPLRNAIRAVHIGDFHIETFMDMMTCVMNAAVLSSQVEVQPGPGDGLQAGH